MPTLNWIGKEKIINHHLDVPYRVLNHQYGFTEKAKHKTETHSGNKIIHGDNLEALKSLLPEYEGKIKCIYIDPPYNTGNEGWVYNDNVSHPKIQKWLGEIVGKESEDLTRHDKWLCMMYPRLQLLHRLLADDGAIFISIDDNEQAYLKSIMDEIFGPKNFIGSFIINTTPNARDYGHIGKMHEFALFYAKKEYTLTSNMVPDKDKKFKYQDEISGFNIHPLYNSNVAFTPDNRPNLYYPFYLYPTNILEKDFFEIGLEKKNKSIEIFPPKSVKDNVQFVWRWGKDKSFSELNKEIIGYKTESGEYRVVQKMRHSSKLIRSIQLEKEHTSRRGTAILEEIFSKKTFSFPKPTDLIQLFLQVVSEENAIILDSFAGSGTTAHAVLNLNKQDGGNRKFILVELEDYAETITAERVKRVIKGYGDTEGTGGSFDYYTIGEPLFDENQNLNELIPEEKIKAYIWYSETRSQYKPQQDNPHFLGIYNDTGYYFIYNKKEPTTLDFDSLAEHITEKSERYVVYADNCLLPESFLRSTNIEFKKIPRNITRF
ncbi:site-specific DNA-methyltransferase [Flavobacterium sp. UBA7680]|uniref:site-specific DNA-methyltransferase n=1 Tax=Flavobacterium sp. UBA7680 TaxID=1946559 RepID=UPI0025C5C34B|nr:site-specific DNA-methyltransferase [Flavobacterium sp. UBA7680]